MRKKRRRKLTQGLETAAIAGMHHMDLQMATTSKGLVDNRTANIATSTTGLLTKALSSSGIPYMRTSATAKNSASLPAALCRRHPVTI